MTGRALLPACCKLISTATTAATTPTAQTADKPPQPPTNRRCRTLYEKYLEWNPANCHAWIKFGELEKTLGEVGFPSFSCFFPVSAALGLFLALELKKTLGEVGFSSFFLLIVCFCSRCVRFALGFWERPMRRCAPLLLLVPVPARLLGAHKMCDGYASLGAPHVWGVNAY